MKIHKEIIWNKGCNPKRDGEYLLARFADDGALLGVTNMSYSTEWGWNCGRFGGHEYSLGQNFEYGTHAWAELPF